MVDTAIIGGGPAGLSAAVNLKILGKEILWFASGGQSRKVALSEKIANYPGLPDITGAELNERFRMHAESLGITQENKLVTAVTRNKKGFMLLAENEIFEAKTVLFATGVVPASVVDGEERLLGRGVSYCATCDGTLYRGKTVAVVCGDKRFEHEAVYLAGLAEKVYLFAPYKDIGEMSENVTVLTSPVMTITGEKKVGGIILRDGTEISLDGVFFLKSAVAPSTLLRGLETDGSHIVVTRDMKTNIDGAFAAGDCTGRPYQIAKAVGEGNIAAHSIAEYLAEKQ